MPLQDGVTRLDVVTRALYLLDGGLTVVDTECIASMAYELCPPLFRWRTRDDQINLELVRVALSDAKKQPTRWVEGTGRTGWSLTASGKRRAIELEKAFPAGKAVSRTPGRRGAGLGVDDSRRKAERLRIQSTDAWKEWLKGERSLDRRHVEEVFRIDTYSNGRTRSLKVNRLESLFSENPDMRSFLDAMAQTLEEREHDRE